MGVEHVVAPAGVVQDRVIFLDPKADATGWLGAWRSDRLAPLIGGWTISQGGRGSVCLGLRFLVAGVFQQ